MASNNQQELFHATTPAAPPAGPTLSPKAEPVSDDALYRRLQVLLRSTPLYHLRALVARQQSKWPAERSYDPVVMALAVVDSVIAHLGQPDGLVLETLFDIAADLASRAEPDAPAEEWRAVAEWVVRGLLTDEDGSLMHTAPYSDYRDGYRRRELRWWMLRENMDPFGNIVVEISTEAINALRGGLDLDIEDAQLARDTVLQAQLARGDFRGAAATAQEALRLTNEYLVKMRDLLDAAKINLDTVDWQAEFEADVQHALNHVQERIVTESAIITHHLPSDAADDATRLYAAQVRASLEACLSRHRRLHLQLQTAPKIFLEEQLRQVLPARKRARLQISPRDDVFIPALSLTSPDFNVVADAFVAGLGLRRIKIFEFTSTLGRLLRPPRAEATLVEAVSTPDEFLEDSPEAVAPEHLARAQEILTLCRDTPRRLSDLLAEAPTPQVAELLRLLALILFDQGARSPDSLMLPGLDEDVLEGLCAELAGECFEAAGYRGDDLLISPSIPDAPIEQWRLESMINQQGAPQ
jgi:hypothetical protein